jgi:hypothetical protein
VGVGQVRFQPNGFSQSRSSGTPFLFCHEHEAKLEMGIPIIRLQCNSRSTFLNGGIQIADTKKGSGEL